MVNHSILVCPKLFSNFAPFLGLFFWYIHRKSVHLHSGNHHSPSRDNHIPSLLRSLLERSPLRRPSGRTIDENVTSSRRRRGKQERVKGAYFAFWSLREGDGWKERCTHPIRPRRMTSRVWMEWTMRAKSEASAGVTP